MDTTKDTCLFPQWLEERALPDTISLQLLDLDGSVLFTSKGKWLHPLMEVQEFISLHHLDASRLLLHDRIAGRAAAALAIHIGFKIVKLSLMSRLAEALYIRHDIVYHADTVVDRIACQTEDLIDDTMDPETIYALIRARMDAISDRQWSGIKS